jgi:hypothetical protein
MEGGKAIAKLISRPLFDSKTGYTLSTLNVSSNNLGSKGVTEVFEAMGHLNNTLDYINLSKTGLTALAGIYNEPECPVIKTKTIILNENMLSPYAMK